MIYSTYIATDKNNYQKMEQPLRLHLGCGSQYLEGYINIDFPDKQREIMGVKADLYADITSLNYPSDSVDEIRLHHVFEHFSRVMALSQLIKWHEWLKLGGKLHIETPDIEGSARIILSDLPWLIKAASIRHLAGDQAAQWAYHLDHWCSERFKRTLYRFGFDNIDTVFTQWPHTPYLANVEVIATKSRNFERAALVEIAFEILSESIVNESEDILLSVWKKQLLNQLNESDFLVSEKQPELTLLEVIDKYASSLPLTEIHLFNQRTRDRWVSQKASEIPAGAKVLDVGAGTKPYRQLFRHCEYKSHDFKKYTGEKRDGSVEYGSIDYESDILNIPVPDAYFDVVLCTEVLEHVPDPPSALSEMSRILRPSGLLLLTAPLGSGLHQLPYHYYGGMTPNWYYYWGEHFSLVVKELVPNGGFFRLLAQENVRASSFILQSQTMSQAEKELLIALFSERLPKLLFSLEDDNFVDQFTVGYHVVLQKKSSHSTHNEKLTNRLARLAEIKASYFNLLTGMAS